MRKSLVAFLPRALAGAALACLFLSMVVMVGCGDGSQTKAVAVPTPTPAVATATAQLRIGDAPVDQLIAFELTLTNPITITLENGTSANATVAGNNRIELSHMASKMEPIIIADLPQGIYKSVQMTFADPSITYVYQRGWLTQSFEPGPESIVQKDYPGLQTVKVDFNPPVEFTTSSVVAIDVNLAKAIVTNPDNPDEIMGVNLTSDVFTFTGQDIPAASEQHHHNGELECMIGQVTAVNGGTLTVKTGLDGGLLDIQTDSSTFFHDALTGPASALNRVVEIEGYTESNGKLYATEVEGLATANGAAVQGVITDAGNTFGTRDISGFKADTFQFIAQDASGANTKADNVGSTYTVHTNYLTDNAFTVDAGKTDITSLGVPVPGFLFPFDSRHLFPGQRVAVKTGSAVPDGDFTHFTATGVMLLQQAVTGQLHCDHDFETGACFTQKDSSVAPQNGSGFWARLELPFDSHVHRLSGYNWVWVFLSPNTDLELLDTNTDQTLKDNMIVRVRGLMFLSPEFYKTGAAPAGSYVDFGHHDALTMLSRRITEMEDSKPVPTSTK